MRGADLKKMENPKGFSPLDKGVGGSKASLEGGLEGASSDSDDARVSEASVARFIEPSRRARSDHTKSERSERAERSEAKPKT